MSRVSVAVALGVLLIVGVWFYVGSFDTTASDQAAIDVEQNKLAMLDAETQTFGVRSAVFDSENYRQVLAFTGRSRASDVVDVKAEVAGKIVSMNVSEWDRVKDGEVVAQIAKRDIDIQIARAETDVRVRREEFSAQERLVSTGASGELTRLKAEGALRAAEATLENLKEQKRDLTLRAPFSGTVTQRHLVEGEVFGKSAPILSITKMDPMLIDIYVTLEKRRQLKRGYPVEVDFDGDVREGEIHNIATLVEPQTRTYQVEIAINNGNGDLVEGMPAEVKVLLPARSAHHFDASYLKLTEDKLGVMVVEGEGDEARAKFVEVTLLADDDEGAWVHGLDGSQRIITAGNYYVKTGDKVSISE